jgi:hypothetical protein
MQIAKSILKKPFFDTSYVFDEYINKYNANFIKYTKKSKNYSTDLKNVKVHIKKKRW